MKVTVADCLKLPALREAQLAAGANGLDRAVSSVTVLEWPEVQALSYDVIIGNELIISTLVHIKDDVEHQCRLLRHLRSMGAAGLIVYYVGIFLPKISDELIAVAEEISFPLIMMPYGRMDFRYSDVIADVAEYIRTQRMQDNYYTTDIINSITLLEPQQRTVNAVLRLLADRLHCTLLLADRYLERRGTAAWPISDQWDYQQVLSIMQNHKTGNCVEEEIGGRRVMIWDTPVPSNQHRGMHLLALDEQGRLQVEMLRQAADVIALFLNIWNKGHYYDGTDALVEAVLNDDPAKMRMIASQMGISMEDVHTMWLFVIAEEDSGRELSSGQKLDIILKLKVCLQEHHKIAIVDSYGSHIVAFTDGTIFDSGVKELGSEFISRLDKEKYAAWGCVFEDLDNTAQVREAYNRMTENQAALRAVYPGKQLFTDSDVRFVQSCQEYIRQGESKVRECLQPISRLKLATDGQVLKETLCVYLLDAESSTQRTGAEMFLHKNTVNYRLNKIRNILKCDLAQMPATLEIYRAAAIYRILEGM